jgi:hypothetical protein
MSIIKLVLIHYAVHGMDLIALLLILRIIRISVAADDEQFSHFPEPLVVGISPGKSGEVFHLVQAGHAEDDRPFVLAYCSPGLPSASP